ncbi:MAG TPA: hypothetical protein PKW90_15665, partial [Myxococcota bacterium]|nr:hypothetical protein [Myxococcota bacterium]
HGPAAYLVDLLHWLDAKFKPTSAPGGAPDTARAALTARRPDLEKLKLSCENTERVLPYIDLSLEILEAVVADGDLENAAYDSEVATEEQLAAPQHTNLDAYDFDHLGGSAVAPRTPFHRPLVEMRPYLDHLGLERTHLMRVFGSEADSPPSARDIAAEELSLSHEAAAVIETHHTDLTLEGAFWPLDLTAPLTVRSLRRAAELTWPDILDILHSRTANSGDNPIHAVAEANPTDVNLWLIGTGTVPDLLVPGEFSRIRQFTRLWRATGWTLLELDKVLVALGLQIPASWNSSAPVLAVGNIHRLCRLTECNPVEIASWFGLIDTWQDRSTREEPVLSWWDQTWLSPSLFSQSEVAESGFPFRLHVARIQVANPALLLLDYTDKLSAVLGIGTEELTALVALFGDQLDLNGSSVPVVTRNNLSILYRWASLARALHLSPTDTFTLAQLVGTNPFQYPQSAINLLETWQELSAAGWSVAELDYVLRHESKDRVAPTDDFLRNALGQIRDALLNTMSASSGSTTLDTLLDDLGRRVSEAFGVDRSLVEELREQEWPNGASAMPDGASVRLPSAE